MTVENRIWKYLNESAAESGADVLLRQAADEIHQLTNALKFIAAGDGCYGAQAAEYKRVANAALEGKRQNEPLLDFARWVDTWVSNPAASYSTAALDGLFGMTRDRLASLPLPPSQLDTPTVDRGTEA